LDTITAELTGAVKNVDKWIFKRAGFYLGEFQRMSLTPDKPNTARTVIPVHNEEDDAKVGDICAILFAPGDGTGDAKIYSFKSLEVPPEYVHQKMPERVLPRKKICPMELFVPFFSIKAGRAYHGLASLEELTIDDGDFPKKLLKLFDLGYSVPEYRKELRVPPSESDHGPNSVGWLQLTTGYTRSGRKFGDPHAIFDSVPETMQVVGFLSIDTVENPLAKAFDRAEVPKFINHVTSPEKLIPY